MTDETGNRSTRIAAARAELARRHAEDPGAVERYEARQARLSAVARRQRDRLGSEGGWCILRTASRSTLTLATSLAGAGIEVWTPVEKRARRTLRGKRARAAHDVAIAPRFVFARADRLFDLARIAADPVSPHPAFAIFHHAGRVPLIADREIAGLRREEDRAHHAWEKAERDSTKPPAFTVGAAVQIEQSAFAGLTGTVEEQRGRSVLVNLVAFGREMALEVDAWHILPVELQAG